MQNDSKVRLLRLLEILKTETDEEHPISIASISKVLKRNWGIDSYRITIQNDIEALRKSGYEIETIRSTQNLYYLSTRIFEQPELKLLLDAVESSKFITQKKSHTLADKILSLTNKYEASKLKRNIYIKDRIKPKNEHIYYYMDVINDAINAQKKVTFRYFTYTAEKKRKLKNNGKPYVLSPYALTWNTDCYYVVGWSEKHNKVATFRVDRISETPIKLQENAVPKPQKFNIAGFSEKAFQLFDCEKTKVKLLCNEITMNSVIDHFGDNADIISVDEHNFNIVVEVSLSPTFFAWVFQFGGKIKILGPSDAIKKYNDLLKASIK